jgi:hypothetical protein
MGLDAVGLQFQTCIHLCAEFESDKISGSVTLEAPRSSLFHAEFRPDHFYESRIKTQNKYNIIFL